MENKFYTYIYLDPRKSGNYICGNYTFEYEPFYVGKGKNGQWISHLITAKKENVNLTRSDNLHKYGKIRKILNENLEPIILKVKENLSEQEAFELEIYLIWAIGRNDLNLGPLTNMSDGGEGFSNPCQKTRFEIGSGSRGKPKSQQTKIKMSISAKGKPKSKEHKTKLSISHKGKPSPMKGRAHSLESNLKNSEKHKNIKQSKETIEKRIVANAGKKRSIETIEKLRRSFLGKTHSKETKIKLSNSLKGKIPWNKGLKNKLSNQNCKSPVYLENNGETNNSTLSSTANLNNSLISTSK